MKRREAFSRFSSLPYPPLLPLLFLSIDRDMERSIRIFLFSSFPLIEIDEDSFFSPFFLFLLLLFLSYSFFFLHPRHARVVKDVQHGASCRYVSQCSSDDVIGVHERRLNERSFGARSQTSETARALTRSIA